MEFDKREGVIKALNTELSALNSHIKVRAGSTPTAFQVLIEDPLVEESLLTLTPKFYAIVEAILDQAGISNVRYNNTKTIFW
jgi:hypothetical protein